MGFIIRGFIWDIPILIFAYVLFWGPIIEALERPKRPPVGYGVLGPLGKCFDPAVLPQGGKKAE